MKPLKPKEEKKVLEALASDSQSLTLLEFFEQNSPRVITGFDFLKLRNGNSTLKLTIPVFDKKETLEQKEENIHLTVVEFLENPNDDDQFITEKTSQDRSSFIFDFLFDDHNIQFNTDLIDVVSKNKVAIKINKNKVAFIFTGKCFVVKRQNSNYNFHLYFEVINKDRVIFLVAEIRCLNDVFYLDVI